VTGEQVRRRIGRRGAVLLILAAVDVGVGWSFISPTEEAARAQNAVWRDGLAPSWFWGGLWIVVGACCLAAAFLRKDSLGFVPAVCLKAVWSALELTGWMNGAIHQGYRPALIWAGVAGIVFATAGLREPCYQGPPQGKGSPRGE
jgi:hypothetical protein